MGIDMDRKLIYVRIKENENPKAFNLAKVKKYVTTTKNTSSFFNDLNQTLENFSSEGNRKCMETSICATEVINQGDPRAESSEMVNAKERKI